MGNSLRRMWMGLVTVLGVARRGFFIPYRYAYTVAGPRFRHGYGELEHLFRRRADDFLDHISSMVGYAAELEAMGAKPSTGPRWDQDWFPRLDGASLYAMVRRYKPLRIVEVGSGHSTRFLARAVIDGGLDVRITAIDPEPRSDIDELGIEVWRSTVQQAGPASFSHLGTGDMLIIDSSHILMPGGDVDFLLNSMLPMLPAGVLVHFHDIFLPDDYPPQWEWRAYNEQLGVATLIQGGGYDIIWSSRYVATRMAEALEGTVIKRLGLPQGAFESSLWLRKLEPL
ncbi:MAG: class I SAM-dependent methyltransferase [Rhodospirillales bacterium]